MQMPEKHAKTKHPILDVLAQRWSPYVFEPRQVEVDKLLTCLEAAHWAASSFNEQPWSWIVARREEEVEFAEMLRCLTEANQKWARNVGVLMITVISKTFARNGNANRVALHDLGLAMGNLCAQAAALDLHVHQMAGVNLERAREIYHIPLTHEPATAVAIGYLGDPQSDPELAQRQAGQRSRKPLTEVTFSGRFGESAGFVQ